MKTVQTLEEFKALQPGTKIYTVTNGNTNIFVFGGTINPRFERTLLIHDENHSKVTWVLDKNFKPEVFILEYDRVEFGKVMISQIEEHAAVETKKIREVYIEGK